MANLKLPDTPTTDRAAIVLALVGLVAQFTGISDEAKDNITTLALSISGFLVAGDTVRRAARSKYLAELLRDRDADHIPDVLENVPLAWWLAFLFAGLFAGTLAALLVVLFA